MKTLYAVALALSLTLAIASIALAGPSLVCDMPTSGTMPTEYQITLPAGQTWMQTTAPALTTGPYGFVADISAAPIGTTPITVRACALDPVWGISCSEAVTYPLERASSPLAPMLRLVAQ